MAFTLVFDGELKDFNLNPFMTETQFGKPRAAAIGDALKEKDDLEDRVKELERYEPSPF